MSAAGSPEVAPRGWADALRGLAVLPIVAYRRFVSPALPRRCKYEPTCSRYAVEAISRYGILRGSVLAVWRLLRCNPWSYGGYDPPEAQRVFGVAGRRRAQEAGGQASEPTQPASRSTNRNASNI